MKGSVAFLNLCLCVCVCLDVCLDVRARTRALLWYSLRCFVH